MLLRRLRIATIFGMALIFGSSAVAVGKKKKKKGKDKTEAVDKKDKDADAPAVGAPTAPKAIEVKCNIPPIRVNVQQTKAAPAAPKKDARAKPKDELMFDWRKVVKDLVLVLIFSLLGLLVAMIGYFVYHWIVPFDLRKELEVDQNTSLGIVVGSIILGLCIIVAAAIASP